MGGRQWVGAALLVAAGGTGCFAPPPEALARLEEARREGAALLEQIDEVEGRLTGARATVSLWSELAERHQRVSEVACESNQAHLVQMNRLLEQQQRSLARRKPPRQDLVHAMHPPQPTNPQAHD